MLADAVVAVGVDIWITWEVVDVFEVFVLVAEAFWVKKKKKEINIIVYNKHYISHEGISSSFEKYHACNLFSNTDRKKSTAKVQNHKQGDLNLSDFTGLTNQSFKL